MMMGQHKTSNQPQFIDPKYSQLQEKTPSDPPKTPPSANIPSKKNQTFPCSSFWSPPSFPKNSLLNPNRPQRPQKTRLHGKWKEGKSEFTIWADGEFKLIGEAPYIEVVSDDGIALIEEYEDGLLMDKSYKLVLTKAPSDGRMRSLNWRKSIFDSPLIKKGKSGRCCSLSQCKRWWYCPIHEVIGCWFDGHAFCKGKND